MRDNPVKKAIRDGKVVVGVMCMEFATPGIGRISAEAGAQFILFDMEHTGWELETIRMLLATSRAADLVPFVRVPVTDYHFIAHALDVGAVGIVVPLVNSPDQAREVVQCAMYPPRGRRGCAFAMAHDDFKSGDVAAKMEQANDQLMIIAQIETVQGLENVEEIVALDGIDAAWIGQFDLTVSMGIPAQFDHPDFIAATRRVVAACRQHGKAAAMGAMNPADLAQGPANGYQLLAYVADLWIYQQALRECFAAIRAANPGSVASM
jgi:2-dehydro-3-deoxyglucarate aldolase/4-hydroxy-2-oxoheptanedioate aldolase